MATKRSFPGPIPILMLVIILAAIGTWLLPAGQYNKLSVTGKYFTMVTDTNEIALPLTQKSLDSLGIQIKVFSFNILRRPFSQSKPLVRPCVEDVGFGQFVFAFVFEEKIEERQLYVLAIKH